MWHPCHPKAITHLAKYTKKTAPTTSCSAVSKGPAPDDGSYLAQIK